MRNYGRLKRNNDFTRLYKSGKSQKARCAVVLVRQNRLGVTRVGFSVSKKIGNAVKRNRCRRRLREAVYKFNDKLKSGFDVVFVARHQDRELPFEELVKEIGYLLSKSDVLIK